MMDAAAAADDDDDGGGGGGGGGGDDDDDEMENPTEKCILFVNCHWSETPIGGRDWSSNTVTC